MKRTGILWTTILLIVVLAACGQTPASIPISSPSATPPPPRVKTEVIAASSPTPTAQPTVEPSPTSIEPTPTLTEAPVENTQAPTVSPDPVETAETTPTAAPSTCEDKAAFYDDVTVPDDTAFAQSVEFVKTWRIRNEGTCTWDGYQLIWAGGSLFDAALSNPIPLTKPGEFADISVKMHSPIQGGVYTSQWEFQNSAGKRFGVNAGGVDLIWVRISVTWYPEGSTSPGVSTIPAPAGGCVVERNPAYIEEILALINAERAANNLSPLSLEPRLSAAAQVHSEDMACKNFSDHEGSDGSSWADRVKAAGYRYSYVSENIYSGDPAFGGDAQGAFTWWKNSPVHYKNMLNPKVTQIGIGFAASDNAQYRGRYTLNFARP